MTQTSQIIPPPRTSYRLAAPAPGSVSPLVRSKEQDVLTIIILAVTAIAFLLGVFVL